MHLWIHTSIYMIYGYMYILDIHVCLPAPPGEKRGRVNELIRSICELSTCPLPSQLSRPWWTWPRTLTPSHTCTKVSESKGKKTRWGILDMQEDGRRRMERWKERRVACWERVIRILNLNDYNPDYCSEKSSKCMKIQIFQKLTKLKKWLRSVAGQARLVCENKAHFPPELVKNGNFIWQPSLRNQGMVVAQPRQGQSHHRHRAACATYFR